MIRALILLEATIAIISIISMIGFAVTGNGYWTVPAIAVGIGAMVVLFIEITRRDVTRRDGVGRRR